MLHAANSGQDVCDLALLQGAFIMPTLNGWLLGYPVVYLVIKENVDSTADFLSTVHLERHITRACCPAFKVWPPPVLSNVSVLNLLSSAPCPYRSCEL